MESRKIIVTNKSGFHVRPAAKLSKFAEKCTSKVEIIYGDNIINAKSMLNIVSTAIPKGTEIELRCSGQNEKADLEFMLDAIQKIED